MTKRNSRPPSSSPNVWFQAIVVVGSGLGCGARAIDDPTAADPTVDGQNALAGAPATSPWIPASAAPVEQPPNTAPAASGMPPSAPPVMTSATPPQNTPSTPPPPDASDCEFTQQFGCDDLEGRIGCRCDEAAPLSADACLHPLHFVCEALPPLGDGIVPGRGSMVDCRCDLERSVPEMCEEPELFFCSEDESRWFENCSCAEGVVPTPEICNEMELYLSCQSYQPRFGCRCIRLTIIK